MRQRVVGAVALGIAAALTLTACVPADQGYTGLLLGDDGNIHGVVHVCDGSVESFTLWDRLETVKKWYFPQPADGTESIELGTPAELSVLMAGLEEGHFSAGTSGKGASTSRLDSVDVDLAMLRPGEIAYAHYTEDGPTVSTASSLEEFEQLSCD